VKNLNPDYLGAVMFSIVAGVNFYCEEYLLGAVWTVISAGYFYSGRLRAMNQRATERLQKTYRDGIDYHYEILRKYQDLKDRQR